MGRNTRSTHSSRRHTRRRRKFKPLPIAGRSLDYLEKCGWKVRMAFFRKSAPALDRSFSCAEARLLQVDAHFAPSRSR
jgi:hypothetical protein